MNFKVEDDIPPPTAMNHGNTKYPFGELGVGQSFFVASDASPPHRAAFYSAAHAYGRRKNKKFAVRKVTGGMRCWRVA